jgi:hypothetical protein
MVATPQLLSQRRTIVGKADKLDVIADLTASGQMPEIAVAGKQLAELSEAELDEILASMPAGGSIQLSADSVSMPQPA